MATIINHDWVSERKQAAKAVRGLLVDSLVHADKNALRKPSNVVPFKRPEPAPGQV